MAVQKPVIKIKLDVQNLDKTIEGYKELAKTSGELGELANKQIKPLENLSNALQRGTKINKSDVSKLIEQFTNGGKKINAVIQEQKNAYKSYTLEIEKAQNELARLQELEMKQAAEKKMLEKKHKVSLMTEYSRANTGAKLKNLGFSSEQIGKYGVGNINQAIKGFRGKEDLDNYARRVLNEKTSKADAVKIEAARVLKERRSADAKKRLEEEIAVKTAYEKTTEAIKEQQKIIDTASKKKSELLDKDTLDKASSTVTNQSLINNSLDKTKMQMDITGVNQTEVEDLHALHSEKLTKSLLKSAVVFRMFKSALKASVNAIKEVDEAITNMTVVTGESRKETVAYIDDFAKMAQATSSTITEMANLTTEFVRQGRTVKDAMMLSEETAKAAKIAGISVKDSLTYMTSAINGFNLAAKDAAHVSDVFAAIAAATATDYNQLAVALSKVSAQASQAGLSMEYTTALLAKGIETTQEAPESIGTALKTVIARFRELSDFGSTLEDGMNVNQVEEALSAVGIALRDNNGEFRNLQDVLNELGPMWDDLTGMQRQAIAQAAAGTRQQSRFLAIMQDWERTMEIVDVGQQAAGASAAQYAKYAEGMTAAITKLQSAWQAVVLAFSDNEAIIGLVDIVTNLLNSLSGIINFFGKSLGYIVTIGGALAGLHVLATRNKQKQLEMVDDQIQKAKNLQAYEEEGRKTEKEIALEKIKAAKEELDANKKAAKAKAAALANEKVKIIEKEKANASSYLQDRKEENLRHIEKMQHLYEEAKGSKNTKLAKSIGKDLKEAELKQSDIEKELTKFENNETEYDVRLKAAQAEAEATIKAANAEIDAQYKGAEDRLGDLEEHITKLGTTGGILTQNIADKFGDIKGKLKGIVKDFKLIRGKGLKAFTKSKTGLAIGKAAMTTFITGSLAAATKAIKTFTNAEEDALKNIATLTSKNYDNTTKINSLKKLQKEYADLSQKVNKTAEEETRLKELDEELTNEYGITASDKFQGIQDSIVDLRGEIGKNTEETMAEAFKVAILKGKDIFNKTEFKATITARLKALNNADISTTEGRAQSEEYNKLSENYDSDKLAQQIMKKHEAEKAASTAGYATLGGALGAGVGVGAGAIVGIGLSNPISTALMVLGGIAFGLYGLFDGLYKQSASYARKMAKETAQELTKVSNDFNTFSAEMASVYDSNLGIQFDTFSTEIQKYSGLSREAMEETHRGFVVMKEMGLTAEKLNKMQGVDAKGKVTGFSNREVNNLIQQAGELGKDSARAFFDSWYNLANADATKEQISAGLLAAVTGTDAHTLLAAAGVSEEDIGKMQSGIDTGIYDKMVADQQKNIDAAAKVRDDAQNKYNEFISSKDFETFLSDDANAKYRGMSYSEAQEAIRADLESSSEAYQAATNASKELANSLLDSISAFKDLRSLGQGLTSLDSSMKSTMEFADRLEKGETTIEDWVTAATKHADLLTSEAWKNADDVNRADMLRNDSSVVAANRKRDQEIAHYRTRVVAEQEIADRELERQISEARVKGDKKLVEVLEQRRKDTEKQTEATLAAVDAIQELSHNLTQQELTALRKERLIKKGDKKIANGNLSGYGDKHSVLSETAKEEEANMDDYWKRETEAIANSENPVDTTGWRKMMDEMLAGDLTNYLAWASKVDSASRDLFKTMFERYKGMTEEHEQTLEEMEANEEAYNKAVLDVQQKAIEKTKAAMKEQYDETKKSLDERKKLYEKYFDAIEQEDEKEDFNSKRQRLLQTISALSGSQDGVSLAKLSETRKELADLEKDQRKKERDERKKNTLEIMGEEQKSIEENYQEAIENNALIWDNFKALGMDAIKEIYRRIDKYDMMTDAQKAQWDKEWGRTQEQYAHMGVSGTTFNNPEISTSPTPTELEPSNADSSFTGTKENNINDATAQTKQTVEKQATTVTSNVITNNTSFSFGDFNFDIENRHLSPEEMAKAIFETFQNEIKKCGALLNYKH